ncbi:LysR family transcriptional regulator [Paraburkholderia sp. RL17-337-BIB-A]|uniref:LysR family transcriptional regulator n=1 Tax=Paraburkholderia sp. RL17-337-BIB-A TaxID=3031636 RepID=UPI0038B9B732
MNTLQNMLAFARVVDTGSFTAAAESLDSTTGVMSRAVSELEAHLRTRLMNRTTRRHSLTTAGERYLARCRRILADVALAEEEASAAHERPAGTLKMLSFASVGQHYILPAISKYREQYPEVKVELNLSQTKPDLFESSNDVAVISASSLPDSDLVSHQLGTTFNILCASPEYLRIRGFPCKPSDLTQHDCLMLQTPAFPTHKWLLVGPEGKEMVEVNGPIQVNIAESLAVAIRAGMGIGMLPIYAAVAGLQDGTLVRVLPNHKLHIMNLYAIYASRRFTDAKITTWVKFLRTHVPQLIARDEAIVAQIGQEDVSEFDLPMTPAEVVQADRVPAPGRDASALTLRLN